MPSPLLATGAGAAGGLETLLARLLAEQQMQRLGQAQAETARHNLADEGLTGQRIAMEGSAKSAAEADKVTQQQAANDAKLGTQVDKRIALRPIGSPVTGKEFGQETGVGQVASGNYSFGGPGQVPTLGPGESPAAAESKLPMMINWKGTQDQIERKAVADATASRPGTQQNKTFTIGGKPVDVREEPNTGKLTAITGPMAGQDVTGKVDHYEKPPSPDRVLIQTGDGYVPRSEARKTLEGGGQVPLPQTAQTRAMSEGARMIQPHVDDVKQQAEALGPDMFGPVMSRIRQLATTAGSVDDFMSALVKDPQLNQDRRVGKFATSLGLLASGSARVHGGARGGGSAQMLAYFKGMLSDSATLPLFLGRLDAVDDYMTGYAAGPGGSTPVQSGPPAPTDTGTKPSAQDLLKKYGNAKP